MHPANAELDENVGGNGLAAADPPRRKRPHAWLAMLVRLGAVGFLGLTIIHGLETGGHLQDPRNPLYGITGGIAGYFGYAADDVTITGLELQDPNAVLSVIGVKPGGPLFFFDAARARQILENVDWVEKASVRRLHPNRLEVEIVERRPYAVWQRGGAHYVIDRTGAALSTLSANDYPDLMLVTGEGGNEGVFELVNHLEDYRQLQSRVKAAARVGQRRWTLYLQNGVRIALPENDMAPALAKLDELQRRHGVLDKAVKLVDLRLGDRVVIQLEEQKGKEEAKPLQVSSRQ
jgi:cell division protein FtsQ